ncbi:MAG: zinc-ribbon domain-containing protein [Solirubrobacteraceae bacterium]
MFFLFFGYGSKVRLRGAIAERTCPRCHNTARWQRLERWRYLSLFFVPIARWHREQLDGCPVCGYAEAHAETGRSVNRRSPARLAAAAAPSRPR